MGLPKLALLVCLLLAGTAASAGEVEDWLAAGAPESPPPFGKRLFHDAAKPLFSGDAERPHRWSQSLFWVGAAADLYTTKRVLETPGLEEQNPLFSIGSTDGAVLISATVTKTAAFYLVRHFVRRGKLSTRRGDALLAAFGGGQLLAARHNLELVRGD